MKELPDDAVPVRRTDTFSETSIPAGLLKSHRTKPGTWGRITVLEGKLLYRILEPRPVEYTLEPNRPGIVEPGIPHEVTPQGPVRFYVEFLKS